jgi:hypothetical protein
MASHPAHVALAAFVLGGAAGAGLHATLRRVPDDLIFPRFGGRSDYAANAAICDLNWVRLSSGEENPCEVDHLTLRSRVFRGGSGSGLLPFA